MPADTAVANESITVTPMAIATASVPNGTADKAYSAKLAVSGDSSTPHNVASRTFTIAIT